MSMVGPMTLSNMDHKRGILCSVERDIDVEDGQPVIKMERETDGTMAAVTMTTPFGTGGQGLTHWGRVMHICVSKLTIIGSDNGLSPGQRQAIARTNAGILLFRSLGTNFSEILIEIHTFSFRKMRLTMSPGKWRTFCLGLNMLK